MDGEKKKDFIRFEQVSKVYKAGEVEIPALRSADFTISEGEFAVIVGASGAGKTTLLNILGGMDTLTSGRVFVDEREISSLDSKSLTVYRRYDVGFVFQFYNLVPNLTALENVELAAQICHWMRNRFCRRWAWETVPAISQPSCPGENSREWRLQGHLPKIPSSCSAMSPPELWTIRRAKRF